VPIDDVLHSLLAAPKAFLESNALVIYGSNKSGSGVKDFVLQGTDETGWRSGVGNAQGAVQFFVMYDAAGFNAKGSGPKSAPFSAHYVSMREFNTGAGSWEDSSATHYTLPTAGPTVMVTSKINGCTFGIGSNADGARLVSHLRPPGQAAAARVHLDQGTRAGFAGGKLEVSVMSSGEQNGTVLAVRAGSNWTFYVQRYQMFSTAVGIINAVQTYK
jgi:hypothetical protein